MTVTDQELQQRWAEVEKQTDEGQRKRVDHTGKIVGTRIVVGKGDKPYQWRWRCLQCGHTSECYFGDLAKRRDTTSCHQCYRVGQKIGQKTIISRGDKPGSTWKWKCKCGNTGDSTIADIKKSPYCRRCLTHQRVGQRINGRVITSRGPKPNEWLWRCDNGHTGTSVWDTLKRHSCGQCKFNPFSLLGKELTTAEVHDLFGITSTSIAVRKEKGADETEAILKRKKR